MTKIKQRLFDAFRRDHAILGRGLYDLETALTAGDAGKARTIAARLDQDAGAHIAFEEEDFYPALKAFLSSAEVDEMYAEHSDGARMLAEVAALDTTKAMAAEDKDKLLASVREMEHHVSECGELFGALGGLSENEMQALYERLESWKHKAPRWSDLEQESGPTSGSV